MPRKEKTLGQVAFEATRAGCLGECSWVNLTPSAQSAWERAAKETVEAFLARARRKLTVGGE